MQLFARSFIASYPPLHLLLMQLSSAAPGSLVAMLRADLVTSTSVVIVPVDVDSASNVRRLLLKSHQQIHGLTIKS